MTTSSALKLHLGCGRKYLDGYVNIDFPDNEHTVQKDLLVDLYADIHTLEYPDDSIEEIRLHHVFEHFSRPLALALLCRWRNWLKPGGVLRIETPDVMASFKLITSPFYSFDSKQQVMRHLFGSHEAGWAVHEDGWYKEKFKITLEKLGFESLKFVTNKCGILRNIEVVAYKGYNKLTAEAYHLAVRELLQMSTIRSVCICLKNEKTPRESELQLLDVWMEMWKDAYELNGAQF